MNELKSVKIMWILMVGLFLLQSCGAYQPGVSVAQGAPLSMGECKDIIRQLANGAENGLVLVKDGSYVFGKLDSLGWRMVLAVPKSADTLIANTKTQDYAGFLRALKETGWERVAPGLAAGVAKTFLSIMGEFLVVPMGAFEGLSPEVILQ